MAARVLPGIKLTGFWPLGFDGWNTENDANLRKLSALVQASVLNKVAVLPGSPADGDIYLLDETDATNPNAVAIRDAGAWVYVAPTEGWLIYDQTANKYRTFDGAAWAVLATGGGGGGSLPALTGNASKVLAVKADESGVEWAAGGGGTSRASSTKWRIRALRINRSVNSEGDCGVGELKFLDAGGNNLCVGGSGLASTTYDSNYPASKAFDGVLTDDHAWYSKNDDYLNQWVAYVFPTAVSPASVSIAPVTLYAGQTPLGWAVEYWSADGWLPVCTIDAAAWADNVYQTFAIPSIASGGGSGGGGGGEAVEFASVSFDVLGGTVDITSSNNVASVTRVSNGRYVVNFATPSASPSKLIPLAQAWFSPFANDTIVHGAVNRNSDQLGGDGITANAASIGFDAGGNDPAHYRIMFFKMGVLAGGGSDGGSGGDGGADPGNMVNGRQFSPPKASLFPTILNGIVLADSVGGGLLMSGALAGDEQRRALKSFTGDMDQIARFRYDTVDEYNSIGIAMRNSVSGVFTNFYMIWNGGQVRLEGSNNGSGFGNFGCGTDEIFLRLKYIASSGLVSAQFSRTGQFWREVASYTLAGLDQVGLFIHSRNTNYPATGQCLYYSDTNNPAPTPKLSYAVGRPDPITSSPHRYWRLFQTAASGTLNVSTIEFRSVEGSGNLSLDPTKAAARDSYSGGYLPGNAFDGNDATSYGPGTGGLGSYVSYDFTTPVAIVEYVFDNNLGGGPVTLALQYSDDSSTWTTLCENPNVGVSNLRYRCKLDGSVTPE